MSAWIVAFLSIVALAPPSDERPLTVSAAISLSDALEEVAALWGRSGGQPIRFNFAGSNALARQILNGAPVDVFISADEAQMDLVERAGGIAIGSRRVIASNQLAVVALPDRLEEVRDGFSRGSPVIQRLAIGDPVAVPAGVYARRYLERQGLWATYAHRVVPTGNVRAALAAVENGSVDAAIVYVSDAQRTRKARVAVVVPREAAPEVKYPAAVMATTRNRVGADRFLAFLESDAAQAILARYGFLPSVR